MARVNMRYYPRYLGKLTFQAPVTFEASILASLDEFKILLQIKMCHGIKPPACCGKNLETAISPFHTQEMTVQKPDQPLEYILGITCLHRSQ